MPRAWTIVRARGFNKRPAKAVWMVSASLGSREKIDGTDSRAGSSELRFQAFGERRLSQSRIFSRLLAVAALYRLISRREPKDLAFLFAIDLSECFAFL